MWEYKIIDSANAEKEDWGIIDIDFQMDPTMPGGPTHFMALQNALNNSSNTIVDICALTMLSLLNGRDD